MRPTGTTRAIAATLAVVAIGVAPACARASFSDPLFVYAPAALPGSSQPPPAGYLSGPCGLAVDSLGHFYVSDYNHDAIDIFNPPSPPFNASSVPTYLSQLSAPDPLDGPCALALDASGDVYANNYHRNVVEFTSDPTPTVIAGAPLDSTHPTGIAIDPATGYLYVNDSTYIAVYDSSGNPVLDAGNPLKIGLGTLGEGYGLALSRYPGTMGRLYVADASDDTVKVYDPSAVDKVNPVATITGPPGGFSSLRDSALSVDRVSGELYVAANTSASPYTEHPQATIDAFDSAGTYEGHLEYNVIDAFPPGLAVDNSASARHPDGTQGRVYVTSGNTAGAGVYSYPPGAATTAPPLAPLGFAAVGTSGSGGSGSDSTADTIAPASAVGTPVEPSTDSASLAANPSLAVSSAPARARHRHRRHHHHHHRRGSHHRSAGKREKRRDG